MQVDMRRIKDVIPMTKPNLPVARALLEGNAEVRSSGMLMREWLDWRICA